MQTMAKLPYHYGTKFRIFPSRQQKELIKLNSDISRTIYNKLIAIDKEIFQLSKVKIPIIQVKQRIDDLNSRKNMKNLANHYIYMNNKNIDSLAKANASQNYKKAWKMYRKVHSAGTPNFHKKGYSESYQTNCQYSKNSEMNIFSGTIKFLDRKHIVLPKIGKIRVKVSNPIIFDKSNIRIGTVTVKKDSYNKYTISLQLASDTPFVEKLAKTDSQVGIDLNTDNFLTVSDKAHTVIDNPRYYRTIKTKLAKAQRKLSRKQRRAIKEHRNLKLSKNYQKQRLLIARLHEKIRHQRNNFLNIISTRLINNHDLIVAENLKSSNMLKNHALAMSIADVGWRTFLEKMTYKAKLYGRKFILVNPRNTTQQCADCGFVMGKEGTNKLSLKDREWICPKCHTHHVRDYNSSRNILAKGLSTLEK
ncbi:transposase, IS605 OrfB family protein [Apilactobacillus ozensis DSM 23829 = JCM 17196]|uniref:Transposase, IS605 OrfB family protein n=2 Tax=Apilactobacillus ozensis TaxID=866801 RepID=A0A0R2ALU2_9LACO|nr:RNA-guided endonuclease TnpB family protein [Apilactobacillus ozensis]KRM68168.1 transposase, IS605 OrfB family protein [Apilactobacillus ozensis DSM 23829 = JCM 17196]